MINIADLRRHNKPEQIVVTLHSRKRMNERGILLRDVIRAIDCGEIIEQYPNDFPFPSCLILGPAVNGRLLHIVASLNDGNLYLITTYFPNDENWNEDGKTRREPTV